MADSYTTDGSPDVGTSTALDKGADTALQSSDRLGWLAVLAYGAPGMGAGYMYLILSLSVMKFSTDVLLISAGVMGTIFGISRIWDAISDPLVGYLSDRTRVRFGRRRSWLLASIIPVCVLFLMVFAPPASLTGGWLVAWMAVAIIGFYSAMTILVVPHLSLGAELSTNYHERSRIFGLRHGFYTFGAILALIGMYLSIEAEAQGPEAARATVFNIALVVSAVTALSVLWAVTQLKERPEFIGRGAKSPYSAYSDVLRNPHARLLIVVIFIEHLGTAVIGTLTLYIAHYVVGRPELAPLMILAYMVPSTLSVPMWIPLSRRLGKVRLWIFSLTLTGLSFGLAFALPFLADEAARVNLIFFFAFFAGLAAGCGGTLAPSIQGDVIDYDELMTGERKEGSYFAAWNFVHKGALGIMLLLTGYVLEISGFVPNQDQPMNVQVWMVGLYGLFPLVMCLIGAFLLSRFTLDEAAHAEVRRQLDAKAQEDS